MAVRPTGKIRSKMPDAEEPVANPHGQGKRPETGQFRLQVDRQTKSSHVTSDAALAAGLVIKTKFPILHVSVYDAVTGENTVIEAPAS